MTIFRPRPILALCGAACLIAVTPYAPRSPGELGSSMRSPAARPALSLLAPTAPHTSAGDEQSAKWSVAAPLTFSEAHPVDMAPTASAAIGFVRAPPAEEAQSDANLAAQFAYADIPEARRLRSGSVPRRSGLRSPPRRSRHRRLRAVRRLRSSTTRATPPAWRRSPRRPTIPRSDRRWNGRRCARTRIRPLHRSPPSLRPIRAGQAASGFATGRRPNWPRMPRRPRRSPHTLPPRRRSRAQE